ncbi:Gypsy retrotransposon integrase-like protein 1 [Bienertia sinuspersici]
MDPIIAYKVWGKMPKDKKLTSKIKRIGARFIMFHGDNYILREIHFEICGNHIGGRTLALKALRVGYYWLTMVVNAKEMVKKCEQVPEICFSNTPPFVIHSMGLDILWPFPEGLYQKKWIIIIIDYFSQWIEVVAISNITEHRPYRRLKYTANSRPTRKDHTNSTRMSNRQTTSFTAR